MLVDNKNVLLTKNKNIIKEVENIQVDSLEIVTSKSGKSTLILDNNGQKLSYHSRYNPVQEAKTIISNNVDVKTEYVLFIGVGLGYVIQELVNAFPEVKFSIFEPNVEVLKVFLENFNLSEIKVKKFDKITNNVDDVLAMLEQLSNERTKIIVHPLYSKIYSSELNTLNEHLKKHLESKKLNTLTDLNFQLRWLENSVVNFSEILTSPNLFIDIDTHQFQDKPVLIVAAGPSLDQEISNIKTIQLEKRAYIFAVGSAVNTLLSKGIVPDALFTYDPLKNNAKVVQKIKDLQLKLPLIFGSSVGYETLQNYPGKKVHFFTSQDSFNTYLIERPKNEQIADAPTIAAIALNIVAKLNMGPILLVGQNLSFTKEKTYASGIEYIDNTAVKNRMVNALSMSSTTGEIVYTTQSYLGMKTALEAIIRVYNLQGKIYNTTYNGLPIAGAEYFNLEALMDFVLKTENICSDLQWEAENSYDQKLIIKKFSDFEMQFDNLLMEFKKVLEIEAEIMNVYQNKIINKVAGLLDKYDTKFLKMEQNVFYRQVIVPVTRVQHKQLINNSHKVREEKRPLKKIELFLQIHSKYLRAIHAAIIQIQPAFEELKKSEVLKEK